jgi:hypothetical protein
MTKCIDPRVARLYASRMKSIVFAAALSLALTGRSADAQIALAAPFDTDYSFTDLGAVPSLPAPAGGLVFRANDPNTLLIGGAANTFSGKIYKITVVRDASQHVTGFTGTATFFADAHGIGSGGIDGGLTYGPNGLLFYTSYSDNSLGQLKPGSTAPDRQDNLTPLGVASSVGSVAFVPAGFAGAGKMKLIQYNSPGNWYDVALGPIAANGTYPINGVTLKVAIGNGPEGVIYVDGANPQFGADSIIVSEYSAGRIGTYTVDGNGDPNVASRRDFMTGLNGAEGALVDPLTGDFLFSTFGGGDRVIVVRGFVVPSSTTTTTTSPGATTTSTTMPTGDCGLVPVGPTFASIRCRLAALNDATTAATGLGNLQAKVLQPLGKAVDRTDEGQSLCASDDLKRTRTRLKQVVRQLIQYSHKLRSHSARKKVPAEVRDPLAAEADLIQADVRALRTSVQCPDDAQ